MEFLEIKGDRKKDWNGFIIKNRSDAFLQSFDWGKFQESVGRKVFYYTVSIDDDFLAVVLIVEHQMPFGLKYWYMPRGPVITSQVNIKDREDICKFLIENISKESKKKGIVFLRMDPAEEIGAENDFIESGLKYIEGSVQPKDTLVLDLKKSEEEILGEMKQKTRYNIRLAEKKGVEIFPEELTEVGFDFFWSLMGETSTRDAIVSHSRDYYYKLLNELREESNDLKAYLYFAKYQENIIASNIVLFFGDYAVYLHGASSNEHRNVMAPYLLQWRQIQDAKKRGCSSYDLWGITVDDENPRWRGITKFKEGFGGRVVRYVGVYEKPINAFVYNLYMFFKKMRRR
jgi:lipid II:glycine glycyltransferase (peptidoglycan interpeptide bridge formation enzyme)